MKNYEYHKFLKKLWVHAVGLYENGNREPSSYFNDDELEFMASVGLKVMDIYDFAEDWFNYQEPDFETFLMINEARRDYFLNIQEGKLSDHEIVVSELPAKTESLEGIDWLPRILPKARAKLRGELPPEIMYGCGGDRRFFKTNDIHPAEFLRVVWSADGDDAKVVSWIKDRN